MAAGLVDISPSDAGHGHGSRDDHITQFGEQVIAAEAWWSYVSAITTGLAHP